MMQENKTKQETLEEAADIDSKNHYKDQSDYWAVGFDSFKRGAKWMQDHLGDTNEKIDHIADVSKMVEDEVEKLAELHTTELDWDTDDYEKNCARVSFKEGYNKAKEKYKWTDDDMRKAYFDCHIPHEEFDFKLFLKRIQQNQQDL